MYAATSRIFVPPTGRGRGRGLATRDYSSAAEGFGEQLKASPSPGAC